jgi:hypothetical protein
MPTEQEWKKAHADLMAKLNLPCKLKLSSWTKVGMHNWDDNYRECYITINPKADFRVPGHLIMHEAAHHRVMSPIMEKYPSFELFETARNIECSHMWSKGHCEHWAQELCKIYGEIGIALPHTTGFAEFAKAAGIIHKVFSKDEDHQMVAVADNAGLLEGA